MNIKPEMLKSVDEVLFIYASMSHVERMQDYGTLAKLAVAKFASETTKQRLREHIWQGQPAPQQRVAKETHLTIIRPSASGHSRAEGANGPGVVAEDPHIPAECPPA